MREPKSNGWVDKKLKSWVKKDIDAPLFQAGKFIIGVCLLLALAYGGMFSFIVPLVSSVIWLIVLFYVLCKYFLFFVYWDYAEEYRSFLMAQELQDDVSF